MSDAVDDYMKAEIAQRRIPGAALIVIQHGQPDETRYYTFSLTADGRVANFRSSLE